MGSARRKAHNLSHPWVGTTSASLCFHFGGHHDCISLNIPLIGHLAWQCIVSACRSSSRRHSPNWHRENYTRIMDLEWGNWVWWAVSARRPWDFTSLAWWVARIYGHWSYQRLSYAGRRKWKAGSRGRWCNVEPRPSTPIGLVVKKRCHSWISRWRIRGFEILSKQKSSSLSRYKNANLLKERSGRKSRSFKPNFVKPLTLVTW